LGPFIYEEGLTAPLRRDWENFNATLAYWDEDPLAFQDAMVGNGVLLVGGLAAGGIVKPGASAPASTTVTAVEQVATRQRVLANTAASQRARASSNFGVHTAGEGQVIGGYIDKAVRIAPRRFIGADDFASLSRSGRIDPKSIRFSQDSIAPNFRNNGGSVQELAAKLKSGQVDPSTIPSIRIVVKDGKVFTLDNRRLRAFQEAGIDIPFKKLDSIPKRDLDKFSTIYEGVDIIIRGTR